MVLELEHGVFRIEAHLDRVFLLEQHRFEQVGRLLGQDERRSHFISGFHLVFHQLVGVGTHECKHRRGQVDIDAVHHGTQLVVGRGEDGLVDAVHEHVHIQPELLLLSAQLRHGGIEPGSPDSSRRWRRESRANRFSNSNGSPSSDRSLRSSEAFRRTPSANRASV